jgi:hypothetical protein
MLCEAVFHLPGPEVPRGLDLSIFFCFVFPYGEKDSEPFKQYSFQNDQQSCRVESQ